MKLQHQVFIGTSGYSYKDWVGPVYPPGTPPKEFLQAYQKLFNFTEINSSYYAIPKPEITASMVRRSHGNFRFTIKAHKSFTHPGSPGSSGNSDSSDKNPAWVINGDFQDHLDAYLRGIAPLAESGKLLGVLAQFPYSFHYTPENRLFLADAIELFHQYSTRHMDSPRLFLEFRGSEWFQESVFRGMQNYNTHPVFPDTPQLKGLPGTIDCSAWIAAHKAATAGNAAAIRLHGRNSANWWTGTNVSRYDYLYPAGEIQEIQNEIRKIDSALGSNENILIISFNNHHRGQAVQNARDLIKSLELIDPQHPPVP